MVYAYPKCRNIVVDDYSKPYRDEVVRYLDLIATTDVGRTLYEFMSKTSKTTRITWTVGEYWLAAGATILTTADRDRIIQTSIRIERDRHLSVEDSIDAALAEDAIFQKKLKGQYAKNHPVMRSIHIGIFEALGLHSNFRIPTADKGTGEGADVELQYHPAGFRQVEKNMGHTPLGLGPGEILYHELVHSLRTMAGLFLRENVPEQWGMDDFEEFSAVLAANMYRSARGFTRLRLDHQPASQARPWEGVTELPADLRDSKRYFEAFKPEIVKWFNNQRGFCVALAGSGAPFNPMKVAAASLGIAVP